MLQGTAETASGKLPNRKAFLIVTTTINPSKVYHDEEGVVTERLHFLILPINHQFIFAISITKGIR